MKAPDKPAAAGAAAAPDSAAGHAQELSPAGAPARGPSSGSGQVAGVAQPPSLLDRLDALLIPLARGLSSLRLTVLCLALGLVLVFFGTMAQDPMGLYLTQEHFFRSFFVGAAPMWAAMKKTLQMLHIYLPPSSAADVIHGSHIPVFPGGYLIGGVLLLNLLASLKRYCYPRIKAGLLMVHVGIILLLVGQLGTDMLARESNLHLRIGQAKNYSESDRQVELVVTDTTRPDLNTVVAIPQPVLMRAKPIRQAQLPFTLRVKQFYINSQVKQRAPNSDLPPAATQGVGAQATVQEMPRVTAMDSRDVPAAIVEVDTPQGSLGTWLVSEFIDQPQAFSYDHHTYQLELRLRRYYTPYTIQLLQFHHDNYPGTEPPIPKNFSSRIRLMRPDTGENREVLIHMNAPLRYAGTTYYQASYDPDDGGSMLQVVHNPGWLTPYFSCVLVGLGLVVQFATHLLGFTFKRKTT